MVEWSKATCTIAKIPGASRRAVGGRLDGRRARRLAQRQAVRQEPFTTEPPGPGLLAAESPGPAAAGPPGPGLSAADLLALLTADGD